MRNKERRFKGKRNRDGARQKKKVRSRISSHFSKRDFVCKQTGEFKISLGLIGALEALREKSNARITIEKGFESPSVSESNYKRNYHCLGIAADITIQGLSLIDTFKLALNTAEIRGVGLNLSEGHVHVDTRKRTDRKEWIVKNDQEIEINDINRDDILISLHEPTD